MTTHLRSSTSPTRRGRTAAAGLAALALATAGIAVTAPAADAAPSWAPADEATITPGVQTVTAGAGQCTANFVFTDGTDVLIGQAAHCSGTGEATDTNGCDAGSLPLGTRVDIDGASRPGELVYSSWLTMQDAGETDPETCQYNDFALVRIDPADHGKVNPSIPFWGGPTALGDTSTAGEDVYSYGNSSLRLGLSPLSPKQGMSLGAGADGWNHPVYTVTPGIPGDSGSAFLDSQGRALGTLSTLAIAPLPASNGVSDLDQALAYANAHGRSTSLALGTEPFSPIL